MTKTPKIKAAQIRLLERLSNASAISGQEKAVRKIITKQLSELDEEVKTDALGNILVMIKGKGRNRLRVLLAAHMDEVGFMITHDDKDGIYQFETVGGIDARQLAGKAIVAGRKQLPGVIGLAPIHLTTARERRRTAGVDSLRIDLGPRGGGKIKPGGFATFAPNFKVLGRGKNRVLCGKAMDDRIGVATLLELIKNAPTNIDLCAAFTVQEEIGLRGARVAAHAFNPDVALAVDTSPAHDLPNWEDEENARYNTRFGAGPALYLTDRGTLFDPRLIRHFAGVGEAAGIPYQFRQPGGGGTDAGAMHKARAGIPTLSISTPGRYLHTAASMVRLSDWQHTLALIYAGLSSLKPAVLNADRA